MIEVELRAAPEGGLEYEVRARVRVEDGRVEMWDPEGLMPVEIPALVRDPEAGRPRRVHFDQEPELWAERLHTILRTGYLVPVIAAGREGDLGHG